MTDSPPKSTVIDASKMVVFTDEDAALFRLVHGNIIGLLTLNPGHCSTAMQFYLAVIAQLTMDVGHAELTAEIQKTFDTCAEALRAGKPVVRHVTRKIGPDKKPKFDA